jgi:hypothetical protein
VAEKAGPASNLCISIFTERAIGLSRPIGRLVFHPIAVPDGMVPAFGGLFFTSFMIVLRPWS